MEQCSPTLIGVSQILKSFTSTESLKPKPTADSSFPPAIASPFPHGSQRPITQQGNRLTWQALWWLDAAQRGPPLFSQQFRHSYYQMSAPGRRTGSVVTG